MITESRVRTIFKSVSWRVVATITTVILVYSFSGEIQLALEVGMVEIFAKMGVFYIHERFWGKVNLGKMTVKPVVIWCTGLSGSGKGILAKEIYEKLINRGLKVQRLDGRQIRALIPNIGFSKEERIRHIKRVGYFSSLLEKNGIIVVASFISPDLEARDFVRSVCDNFIEVFVDTKLEDCKNGDHNSIYLAAQSGEIKDLAGVNFQYEKSSAVDYHLVDATESTVIAAAEQICNSIRREPVQREIEKDELKSNTLSPAIS